MADADNYEIKIKDLALFVRNVVRSCRKNGSRQSFGKDQLHIPHPTCRSQSRYGSPWQHEIRPEQHVFGTVAEKTGDCSRGQ
jgi:hypothetical protein